MKVILFLFICMCTVTGLYAEDTCNSLPFELKEVLSHTECESSSDCIVVHMPEPYGCNLPLNKKYLPSFNSLYSDFNTSCGPFIFNCLAHAGSIWCRQGSCVPRVTLDRRYPSIGNHDYVGRDR